MNKFLLPATVLILALTPNLVHAQSADQPAAAVAPADSAPAPAEQPPAAPSEQPAPAPVPVVAAPSSPSVVYEAPLTKGLREGLPLRVRQEQAFDANVNNRLEPDEIKAFLKSVYQETARGPVKNTSDILYQYDRNKDGFIDRSEAGGFSQYSM